MNLFDDILDFFIALVIIFIFPLLYFGLKEDTLLQTVVSIKTEEFVSDIKSDGYLTRGRYDQYLDDLAQTGLLYEVSLVHRHKLLEPEYKLRTEEEVAEALEADFNGTNDYTFHSVTSVAPVVSDPVNTGTLNTETNASVMNAAVNTATSPSHVHTDACYSGHKHTDIPTFTHYHVHDGSCQPFISYSGAWSICGNCGTRYQNHWYMAYWNASTGAVVCSNIGDFNCPNCGSSYRTNTEYHQSISYSCGYDKDLDGDGWTDNTDNTTTYAFPGYTYPQQSSTQDTYVNGCWSYHTHKYAPSRSWGFTYGWTYNASIVSELYINGPIYCYMPGQISLIYTPRDTGSIYRINYNLSVVNGSIYCTYDSAGGYGILSPFPSMYLSELYKYTNSSYWLYDLLSQHVNGNYLWGWQVSDVGVSASNSAFVPEVKLCSFITENQWILNCGLTEDSTLDCGAMVTSISPTHSSQTVATGDPLITTVLVTHADGSTSTQIGTCNFSTAAVASNRTVTITYSYTVDGVTYSKTCNITVNVVQRTKTCGNGHVYNMNSDGTDPGCPYCKAWIKSLTFVYPTSGVVTIYKGTSLEDNNVTLLATYLDGHTEYLYDEYLNNLDKEYVGTQVVTLTYKGVYKTLTVITKRNLTQCSTCGKYYELYPDNSDPGCPYCLSLSPAFTGNILTYEQDTYKGEILAETYEGNGTYYFEDGDYISVTVVNTRGSFGRKLMAWFCHNISEASIHVIESGYVRESGQK